jgi:hypothetical protein
MITESLIKQIVNDFLHPKPKSLCICDKPDPLEFDVNYWAKCKNCGQVLSLERCVNLGLSK